MFGVEDDETEAYDPFEAATFAEPPVAGTTGPSLEAAAAEGRKRKAEAAVNAHPEMRRTGDSKRKSAQEIADLCTQAELIDVLKDRSTELCSKRKCPNAGRCISLLTPLALACVAARQSAFTGPRLPGRVGCIEARAELAFDLLSAAHLPEAAAGEDGARFVFSVHKQEICEPVARWIHGFHYGQQWDTQRKIVLSGATTFSQSRQLEVGLGRKKFAGGRGVLPSDRSYKAGHIVSWLRALASMIGDHMPGGDQSHADVLVLPFRRWMEVHREYNQACEFTAGMSHFQASAVP